ncbi:MAG: MFS transporter [Planctomycetota bacterium]|nr:MFS transporter [Planctomycetota bacterium]
MHGFEELAPATPSTPASGPWHRELNRYHWFVLAVAALGWLFDTMDQQLFTLARNPAMRELLTVTPGELPAKDVVDFWGKVATSIFLVGWATGGLAFGILGDRIGRAKVMLWTILLYSAFTGLSAFSWDIWSFSFFRFLTGLGVGGEFAVGVALVAEVMPSRARPFALGLLQALSAVGNITAAFINIGLGHLEGEGAFKSLPMTSNPVQYWRIMFVVGTLPALLAILVRRRLKEPEQWQAEIAAQKQGKKAGSVAELFGDPRWRKNALAGLALAFAGVVGLWGIGFFSYDLISNVFRKRFEDQGMSPADITKSLSFWVGIASVVQNIGGFFGIYAFSYVTHWIGRKPAFFISFIMAMFSTMLVYWSLDQIHEIFWMLPIMGFCQLALFGGYAIYFPELFPTRLRSTGTSFCYNVGRYVSAAGIFALGLLTSHVFSQAKGYEEPMRWAGVTMSLVFLVGLIALPFAPETKGQPLPE